MRCFVAAVPAPEDAERLQQAFADVSGQLHTGAGRPARWRPVPVTNYHVTLKFLGDIAEEELVAVLAAVDRLAGHELSAAVLRFVGFPQQERARLVAAELAAQPRLQAWAAQLDAELGSGGRPFRPHVTVARLARPRSLQQAVCREPLALALAPPRLYRSVKVPGGVRYQPLGPGRRVP